MELQFTKQKQKQTKQAVTSEILIPWWRLGNPLKVSFIYLKSRVTKMKKERKRGKRGRIFPFTDSFPKLPQQPGMSQAEAKNPGHHLGLYWLMRPN